MLCVSLFTSLFLFILEFRSLCYLLSIPPNTLDRFYKGRLNANSFDPMYHIDNGNEVEYYNI